MQSMFRLPWSSDPHGDKIMEKAKLHKSGPIPAVNFPLLNLKRKRTDSPEPGPPHHAQMVKKYKGAYGEVKPAVMNLGGADGGSVVDGVAPDVKSAVNGDAPPEVSESKVNVRADCDAQLNKTAPPSGAFKDSTAFSSGPLGVSKRAALQQTIEAQFDYEILLKHNELRLIEQELAKCQVALEQLRRCQIVPYPGTDVLSENVSKGVGPALQPRHGFTEPQYAAPWGVTDGPYTRHYAKWLIPDPRFDSMPEHVAAAQNQQFYGSVEGRATRGSFADHHVGSKSRTSRTSTAGLKFQALGENPAPVPKQDPLLHKRSTDGQWVRLYCAACKHSNFSNTQGFLNHCRIKHNQVFKSHDAAAIACGVPVDTDELGTVLPPSEPAPTPAVGTSGTPLVHPLIRNNPPAPARNPVSRIPSAAGAPSPAPPAAPAPISAKPSPALFTPNPKQRDSYGFPSPIAPGQAGASPFVPSPQTPYMSALLQKHGFPGNLKQLVETARTKVDLDSFDSPSDDESSHPSGQRSAKATPISENGPLGDGHARSGGIHFPSHRPSSKKSGRLPNQLQPPSLEHSSSAGSDRMIPESPTQLSPHTVESNPGLVSDHEDDDDDDDARSLVPNQESFDMELDDVLVQDASDVENSERRKDMFCKASSSRK